MSGTRTREASLGVKTSSGSSSSSRKKAGSAGTPGQAVAQVVAVAFAFAAKRRGEWWALQPDESKALAEALDPVLARVPIPEKELGVAAELGALGFCMFAIVAPRLEVDGKYRELAKAREGGAAAAVAEAERITAQHAQAPYGPSPLDGLRTPMGDPTAVNLDEAAGITVADTSPDLIMETDATARELGITPERVVELRQGFGQEDPFIDARSAITDGQGVPLDRGIVE